VERHGKEWNHEENETEQPICYLATIT